VAPLAVGLLIKRTGSYTAGFELGSVVLLLGLPAYLFVVGELNSTPAEARAASEEKG
jgi:MFS-type transporter involved in bile tolerance (Atg22 family)